MGSYYSTPEKSFERRHAVLCGSTLFKPQFEEWAQKLSWEDVIVTRPEVYSHWDEKHNDMEALSDAKKEFLDALHICKIAELKPERGDFVMILNVDGYIGKSTTREREFALSRGLTVRMLEGGAKVSGNNYEQRVKPATIHEAISAVLDDGVIHGNTDSD